MKGKRDVQQGTLASVVLKTLEVLGALHGNGIARCIEQIRGELLYRLTRARHKLLEAEGRDWERKAASSARFFEAKARGLA